MERRSRVHGGEHHERVFLAQRTVDDAGTGVWWEQRHDAAVASGARGGAGGRGAGADGECWGGRADE